MFVHDFLPSIFDSYGPARDFVYFMKHISRDFNNIV